MLSVIEFQDPVGEIMVARVPIRGTAEFATGSQLIVQDGQLAVFYRDGRPTDGFKAGRHTLTTQNLPILTKLLNLPSYGLKSPFRAYVYFIQLKTFTNLGWGTPTPILFRDSEFKAVHLRAHGIFSLRIEDPNVFLRTIVGSQGFETTHAIEEFVRRIIVARFANFLPSKLTTVLDLPAQYQEIEAGLKKEVFDDLAQYGLGLVDLLAEAITVPPEVQEMIDRAAGSRALDQSELRRYQTMAISDAVRDSAKQPGGGAAEMIGLGAGMAMGQQIAADVARAGPPPFDQGAQWHVAPGGKPEGPLTIEDIQARARDGQVTPKTLVWRNGMSSWTAAGDMPELHALFGAEPPPIPPAR